MELLDRLVSLMTAALLSEVDRVRSVAEFQRLVWERAREVEDDRVREILSDLAYDLDYYEPDAVRRSEDESYYGNDRLEGELATALKKLRDAGVKLPTAG